MAPAPCISSPCRGSRWNGLNGPRLYKCHPRTSDSALFRSAPPSLEHSMQSWIGITSPACLNPWHLRSVSAHQSLQARAVLLHHHTVTRILHGRQISVIESRITCVSLPTSSVSTLPKSTARATTPASSGSRRPPCRSARHSHWSPLPSAALMLPLRPRPPTRLDLRHTRHRGRARDWSLLLSFHKRTFPSETSTHQAYWLVVDSRGLPPRSIPDDASKPRLHGSPSI